MTDAVRDSRAPRATPPSVELPGARDGGPPAARPLEDAPLPTGTVFAPLTSDPARFQACRHCPVTFGNPRCSLNPNHTTIGLLGLLRKFKLDQQQVWGLARGYGGHQEEAEVHKGYGDSGCPVHEGDQELAQGSG